MGGANSSTVGENASFRYSTFYKLKRNQAGPFPNQGPATTVYSIETQQGQDRFIFSKTKLYPYCIEHWTLNRCPLWMEVHRASKALMLKFCAPSYQQGIDRDQLTFGMWSLAGVLSATLTEVAGKEKMVRTSCSKKEKKRRGTVKFLNSETLCSYSQILMKASLSLLPFQQG